LAQEIDAKVVEARKLLVERIAASRYVSRSARLKDLFFYLSSQVFEGDAGEIHEQQVGHQVFGRPKDYDTSADNIVRVHASMLRKRLEQYFAAEGANEPLILEIPKGNYAPVFRERPEPEIVPAPIPEFRRSADWRLWTLAAIAVLFACSTAYLLLRASPSASLRPADPLRPTVRLFWSQVFHPDRRTDIVLDDAAFGLYDELTGRQTTLSSYFDRTYLRNLPESAAAAHLEPRAASSIVIRRISSFSGVSFLWKLFQMAGSSERPTLLRFARDYSFRELKANNAVLLGNSRSNPWTESFEPALGLRWVFEKATGTYYPVDTWDADKKYQPAGPGDAPEGYCSVSLLPNLSHTGNVLIIAASGGSAMNACADFLADEQAVSSLRSKLPPANGDKFPAFEALVRVKGRSTLPRDASIVLCRTPRG
jgi:hypothetical protein